MDPVVTQQSERADRLAEKFRTALRELDLRRDVLLSFYNECEAKLGLLEARRRDYEESKRLTVLSERADEVVLDTTNVLGQIAGDFLSAAQRVGEALGAVERLQLKEVAGELPLDQIEVVADRIIESSQREQSAIANLAASLSGIPGTADAALAGGRQRPPRTLRKVVPPTLSNDAWQRRSPAIAAGT